jgi:hypothetical protein
VGTRIIQDINMNAPNQQALALVATFSSLEIPETMHIDSGINELIGEMVAVQNTIKRNAQRLERFHRDKKHGHILGYARAEQEENLQDAQVDLSRSIGSLTQKTSQFLIFTAAMSKVLNDQQTTLRLQADEIRVQNGKISAHQDIIEVQQEKINAANLGLMVARGINQSQAAQLVNCVERVEQAQVTIELAHVGLHEAVEKSLQDALAQSKEQLDASLAENNTRLGVVDMRLSSQVTEQAVQWRAALNEVAYELSDVKANLGQQLQLLRGNMQDHAGRIAVQDSALQQLQEDHAVQLKILQQDMASALELRDQKLSEALAQVESKRESTQQELAQKLTESLTQSITQSLTQAFTEAMAAEHGLVDQRIQSLAAIVANKANSMGSQMKKMFSKKSG